MSTTSSQDVQIQSFAALLAAIREIEGELWPGHEPLLDTLESLHGQALDLRSRRAALTFSAQEMTAQLAETLAAGRECAMALRSLIRGKLGPRSEKLERFGVKPLRKRRP